MASSFASVATDASSMSDSRERTASLSALTNSWLDAVHSYSELEAESSAIFSSQHGTLVVECVNWATHDTGRPESPLTYDKTPDVRSPQRHRICDVVAMSQDLFSLPQSFVSVLADREMCLPCVMRLT